ncbi:hypothetical protein [Aquisalibacillus elongatus]|uniref:Uncharacterized protein n=1 Tax=Aquisalibacillus elongatus TaxID=485577 RepID=A0A3N5C7Y0_9BACI|nr:hypothetical protein [Aquisalibacillus elongatus]RPF55592.1 hypothetical protein EDC24_0470 [Aquisalibacillus elongatus]
MGFFDAIAGNIFVLIAIIAGLMSLFKRGEADEQEEHQRPQRRPQPSKVEPQEEKRPEVTIDTLSKDSGDDEVQIDTSNKWYEQLQESQQRLEESETEKDLDKIKRNSLYKKDQPAIERISIKNTVKDRKRLVESLVMSEVLGQPKSKQSRR